MSNLSIGLVTSESEESKQLISLLESAGIQIVYHIEPASIENIHIEDQSLNVWLLNVDDAHWHDNIDLLLDESEASIYFNEPGSLQKQSHPEYWIKNLVSRLYELTGISENDSSSGPIEKIQTEQVSPSESKLGSKAEPELDSVDELSSALDELESSSIGLPVDIAAELVSELENISPDLETTLNISEKHESEELITDDILNSNVEDDILELDLSEIDSTELDSSELDNLAFGINDEQTNHSDINETEEITNELVKLSEQQDLPNDSIEEIDFTNSSIPMMGSPTQDDVAQEHCEAEAELEDEDEIKIEDFEVAASLSDEVASFEIEELDASEQEKIIGKAVYDNGEDDISELNTEELNADENEFLEGTDPSKDLSEIESSLASTLTLEDIGSAPVTGKAEYIIDDEPTSSEQEIIIESQPQESDEIDLNEESLDDGSGLQLTSLDEEINEELDQPIDDFQIDDVSIDNSSAGSTDEEDTDEKSTDAEEALVLAPLEENDFENSEVENSEVETAESESFEIKSPEIEDSAIESLDIEEFAAEKIAVESVDLEKTDQAISPVQTEYEIPMLEEAALGLDFKSEERVDVSNKLTPCWVIGASLGGPAAVKKFFQNLPADINASFVVAQHIDESFLTVMAEILSSNSHFEVKIANGSCSVEAGKVYLAPLKGKLIFLKDGSILVDHSQKWSEPYMPCIDDVIESLAAIYGDKSGAIIFSGMGKDGLKGVKKMHSLNGQVWAQSPDTCANSSMPEAVIDSGLATVIADPKELADKLANYLK